MSHMLNQGLKDLGRHVEAPFTIAQLSGAKKEQFMAITQDRDTLAQRIDSDKTEQLKINRAHDATVVALQDDIRQLQATIARLEITTRAPLAPRASDPPRTRSPSRRVSPLPRCLRSRSRSPTEPHADFKRSCPELAEIRMGPIPMHLSMGSRDSFHTYLDTALPICPPLGQYEVHRSGNYIIVEGVLMENACTLARTWNAHTVNSFDLRMMLPKALGPASLKVGGAHARCKGNDLRQLAENSWTPGIFTWEERTSSRSHRVLAGSPAIPTAGQFTACQCLVMIDPLECFYVWTNTHSLFMLWTTRV
ncbi:hypothetical protein C8R45DRAFT_1138095 [Mycena sanguinolenta]|nr:hypothetical protein C8R45DRAFT_1138095 [Mycena sanguinolenta]